MEDRRSAAVVGFNLGDFAMKEAVIPGKPGDNLSVDAYANRHAPDMLSRSPIVRNHPAGEHR